MTDDEVGADVAPAAGGLPASFGARLAAAREQERLSVGDMAARLRLHVKQVRAIESEDLAHLPEAAYVRGFVRSYARSLGLDPGPLIDDLNSKLAPAPSQPMDESGALLLLTFSGSSWVEVTDASGKVVVSQTAGAGEAIQPVGKPPFAVVIGDASKATVKVRGEAFDLEPVTRANIARFTVK
jgi:cytoskeletal protein RodZ